MIARGRDGQHRATMTSTVTEPASTNACTHQWLMWFSNNAEIKPRRFNIVLGDTPVLRTLSPTLSRTLIPINSDMYCLTPCAPTQRKVTMAALTDEIPKPTAKCHRLHKRKS